jgi:hypothetical protein
MKTMISVLSLSLLTGLIGNLAVAHPDEDWAVQFATLARWTEAVTRGDGDTVASLTAQDSQPFSVGPDNTVTAGFATFSETDAGIVAGPVILDMDSGAFFSAWNVLLVEEDVGWRVKSVMPGAELPPELIPGGLPEHDSTVPVRFELVDAGSGRPVHARVHITGSDGEYWPPDGHQKNIRTGWRQDVGGDVHIDGKTYAYVRPEFTARLPQGDFTIEVRKGTEYLPVTNAFKVSERASVRVEVERWIDMKARGWHAGDTHTHFLDDHTGLLELRAEDLSVLYILATKWGELITDANRFTGKPSVIGDRGEVVVFNEETRHNWLGHTILHGIDHLVFPFTWGGPTEGVIGGYDYPAMAHQADKAHEQGGLVTWAHFPFPGGELAVDVGLDKIDTVDLFTWGDAFASGPQLPDGSNLPSAVESWYQYLNTNARLPATAGTDKMLNVQVSGSVKTYAFTGRDFSYRKWLDALKSGRTTVSTGPIVTMTANGRPIGSELQLRSAEPVTLNAELLAPYAEYPVEVLEIVAGGRVVASVSNDARKSELTLDVTIEPESSTWVAARARGSRLMPYQVWQLLNAPGIPPMAHTSPIYLSVDGQPVWVADDARQLEALVDHAIDWATNEARYQTEDQRQEIIELYQRAKTYYATGPSRMGE